MKKLVFLFLISSSILQAQSLYDYLSQDGLKFGGNFVDDVGGTGLNSYQYCGEETYCDYPILKYYPYFSGFNSYIHLDFTAIYVEGEKVYKIPPFSSCDKTLLYDFSVKVGDVITEGFFTDFSIDSIYNVTILDGSTRKRYDLSKGQFQKTSWIYGIGDITKGFIPERFQQNNFTCARVDNQLLWENEDSSFTCEESTCSQPRPFFKHTNEGTTLYIEDQSSCGVDYRYLWDFGDGNTSTEMNPVHEYENFGCYQITLLLQNDCFPHAMVHTRAADICTNNTWENQYNTNATIYRPSSLRLSESIEIIFGYDNIIKTIDAGQTWNNVFTPTSTVANSTRSFKDIKFYDENKGIIIYDNTFIPDTNQTSIVTTQDGGTTWIPAYGSFRVPKNLELGENGLAWIYVDDKLLRSKNYGVTWEELPDEFPVSSGEFHYVDETNLYRTGTKSGIFYISKSIDQGDTWESTALECTFYNIKFFDAMNVYALARLEGGISISNDGGKTWTIKKLPIPVFEFDFNSPKHGWIASSDNTVYYTSDFFETYNATHCTGMKVHDLSAINDTIAVGFTTELNAPSIINHTITKVQFNKNLIGECAPLSTLDKVDADTEIYPNPASDLINIKTTLNDFTINIYTINGREIDAVNNQTTVDISALTSGTYILSITDTNGETRQFKKFIVLK